MNSKDFNGQKINVEKDDMKRKSRGGRWQSGFGSRHCVMKADYVILVAVADVATDNRHYKALHTLLVIQ